MAGAAISRRGFTLRLPAAFALFGGISDPPRGDNDFATELIYRIDPAQLKGKPASKDLLQKLCAQLRERGELLGLPPEDSASGDLVTVEPGSPGEIRVVARKPGISIAHARYYGMQGRLSLRRLPDVATSTHPDRRFLLETVQIGSDTEYRLRERDGARRPQPLDTYLQRAPAVFESGDIKPGSARPELNGAVVRFDLNDSAMRRYRGLLKDPGQVVAVLLDDLVVSFTVITPSPRFQRIPAPPPEPDPTLPLVGKDKKRRKPDPKAEEAADVDRDRNPKAEHAHTFDLTLRSGGASEANLVAALLNAPPLPVPLKLVTSRLIVVPTTRVKAEAGKD